MMERVEMRETDKRLVKMTVVLIDGRTD